MPNWLTEAFADPGIRTVRAVLVFFFHAITMAAVLICMKAVQLLVEILWGKTHVMVFGQWDLEWLFQIIDVALIVVVGIFGVAEAITVYRRPIPALKRPLGGLDKVVDADFEETS